MIPRSTHKDNKGNDPNSDQKTIEINLNDPLDIANKLRIG